MTNQQFLQQFGHFIEAPNGIQKLRELILQLAVQGKLVPQDPSDEEVVDLLVNISNEKKRLINEGITKGKQLPKITVDGVPHQIPATWQWVRLGDIAIPQAGFAFKSREFNEIGKGLPLIRIRDVGKQHSNTFYDGEYREEFLIEEGDYLISMDGEFRVATWTGPTALLNQRVTRLIFIGDYCAKRFVAEALQFRLHELQGIKAYTTVDHLSGKQIAETIIGLPPLPEQHRIVAKVDELMALCDRLETERNAREATHQRLIRAVHHPLTEANDTTAGIDSLTAWHRIRDNFADLYTTLESVQALRQTILQLAVQGKLVAQDPNDEPTSKLLSQVQADRNKYALMHRLRPAEVESISDDVLPFEKPDIWIWVRLAEICKVITDGDHQPPPKTDAGIAFLTIGNVSTGSLDFTNCRYVPQCYFDQIAEYRRPVAGDLLYTVVGATYGRPIFIATDRPFCVQRHIAILKPASGMHQRFMHVLLSSPFIYAQATHSLTGTAQPTVPLRPLRNFLVALPPLAEQHRIVAKVEELMALCDQLEANIRAKNDTASRYAEAIAQQFTAV